MADREPRLAEHDIQGNVVPGFNSRFQRLLGLRFGHAAGARAWLGDIQPQITRLRDVAEVQAKRRAHPDDERPDPGRTWINVCLSHGGLALLIEDQADEIWDPWFRGGMWRTAGSLGDGDISAWKHGNAAERTPHVLAILGDVDSTRLQAQCETFVAQAELRGLTLEFEECGSRLDGDREHFGFRDGISVPVVRGTWRRDQDHEAFLHPERGPGDPLYARRTLRGRALVWPGQAVFGYPSQSPIDVLAPGPPSAGGPDWMTNGSLLVFRRLRQHVERFKAFTEDAARALGLSPEHVGAMLVGRWPNGTPLLSHPRRPGPDEAPLNDFAYVSDRDLHGARCPQIAHIRKVNPRDAPTDRAGEARTLALQPFRRGIPFAGPSEDGVGEERGLLFLAYTTSIRQGFGALSLGWMNRADGPEAGRVGPDMLAGRQAGERRVRLGDREVTAPAPWVEPTGGGYFFAPAISVLGRLARDEL